MRRITVTEAARRFSEAVDADWAGELRALRAGLAVEDRPWSD